MATLGFSTKWPKEMGGGDTHFLYKIWKGLRENELASGSDFNNYAKEAFKKNKDADLFPLIPFFEITPKLHTIRRDEKDLWKPGRKIHPVVFNRTKDRFQFAPVLECKSVQKIEISHSAERFEDWILKPVVRIDDFVLLPETVHKLALNDGFDGITEFFQWFDKDFEGKIIHFTDLKY